VVGVPIVAYLLGPLLQPRADVWVSVGPVTAFPAGATQLATYQDPSPQAWAGLTAVAAVWVRHDVTTVDEYVVFAVNCTHLGCPVNWNPDGKIFLCPCHGGVYYADGTVAGGPPPLPLFRHQARVNAGRLEILTRALPIG
jgi:menaquinol-cytochrome c reductase iron-sulfur subunit